jgi:hypothetical protein
MFGVSYAKRTLSDIYTSLGSPLIPSLCERLGDCQHGKVAEFSNLEKLNSVFFHVIFIFQDYQYLASQNITDLLPVPTYCLYFILFYSIILLIYSLFTDAFGSRDCSIAPNGRIINE